MKQVQDAYIVAATRSPIGKSGRGYFRNTRPDELLVSVISQSAMLQVPTLDPKAIEDAIIGCSVPRRRAGHEHGPYRGRRWPGNRPRSAVSPSTASAPPVVTAIQMAADRIRVGEADVLIAGGAESMSMVPMGGNKPSFSPARSSSVTRTSALPTAWA